MFCVCTVTTATLFDYNDDDSKPKSSVSFLYRQIDDVNSYIVIEVIKKTITWLHITYINADTHTPHLALSSLSAILPIPYTVIISLSELIMFTCEIFVYFALTTDVVVASVFLYRKMMTRYIAYGEIASRLTNQMQKEICCLIKFLCSVFNV